MAFLQKLRLAVETSGSCLCVGLDPYVERIPAGITDKYTDPPEQVLHFLKEVINVTGDHCAAYKPNLGFFEALGAPGLEVFKEVVETIPDDKIIIADAKRGDISSTAEHYAKAYFEQFDVDAITLNPLMGFETLDPFRHDPQKAVFVLTLTSNPGADDFLTQPFKHYPSTSEYIAEELAVCQKASDTHIGMVIGATKPESITPIIQHYPEASLLIPGVGAQGGAVEPLASALENHRGVSLINSSRRILYAGGQEDNWQEAVADKALQLKNALQPL